VIRTTCRMCSGPTQRVIDLGEQPPSNSLLDCPIQPEPVYPLNIIICQKCALVQAGYDVPHAEIFGAGYPYFSGQSAQWRQHCYTYVQETIKRIALGKDDQVIEIGGNDGTLLQYFPKEIRTLNAEPSESVAMAAIAAGVDTQITPFESKYVWPKADLIIANNVMAHTPDPEDMIKAVSETLKIHGVLTVEFPWIVNTIEQRQFDTMYHEHYSYLGIMPLQSLLLKYGLIIYDVEHLPFHGGSLRIWVCRTNFRPDPLRTQAVAACAVKEMELDYSQFEHDAQHIRAQLMRFLDYNRGRVYGYAAAAKGNTLLNYCKAHAAEIPMVADTTPAKQGKWLPGSRIPIVTPEAVLAAKPEYILILAWNWKDEIVKKLRSQGYTGKFVTAIPRLEVFE
jgi:hypothetical protein